MVVKRFTSHDSAKSHARRARAKAGHYADVRRSGKAFIVYSGVFRRKR